VISHRFKQLFEKIAQRLSLAALLLASSCLEMPSSGTQIPEKQVLQPMSYRHVKGWRKDKLQEPFASFLASCQALTKMDDAAPVGQGLLAGPAAMWKSICREASQVPPNDSRRVRRFFETSFVPFRTTSNGNRTAFFTGYYEPLLTGSRTPKAPYIYPLYALPPAGTPTYTRQQIDQGALDGRATVIAYVDDPVARFFLQVQGSGRITLAEGGEIFVGYAGSNGLAYTSIGAVLVNRGIFKKEEVTMPLLRQWLSAHPNEMSDVLWQNASYIFFRENPSGAVGAEQVPLTPNRSLAVDQRFVPLGMPVFIEYMLPSTPKEKSKRIRKLLIAQDTGSAIRGPARGDIFFGFGENVQQLAGQMKSSGEMIVLVPRSIANAIAKQGS
jgi:membrane-bound lytic murein transglycosylase A